MEKVNIIISTKQTIHHEWMAFICWYSIHKNFPEAKAALVFPRSNSGCQFDWANRCNVPYINYPETIDNAIENLLHYKIITSPYVLIEDNLMVLEPFSAEDQKNKVVDFLKCGNFQLSEWMKKEKGHPFKNFKPHPTFTEKENKVLTLWNEIATTFDYINRK